EQAELIPRESIEILTAEIRAVQVKLLKRTDEEIARQARLVFLVRRRRRRRRRGLAGLGQAPGLPCGAAEPRAVPQQTVAGAPILPGAAEALRHGARRPLERVRGRRVFRIAVEAELVLETRLLKRRRLPAEIEAGGLRPGQHALAPRLAGRRVQAIA